MHVRVIKGRPLVRGEGRGRVLFSEEPISFYGGVDPLTGTIVEKDHPLEGESVRGKILVFPYGKGSTVGSYVLLRMGKRGVAPSGIVNLESEPIILVGCILASIPLMDKPREPLGDDINDKRAVLVVNRESAFLKVIYE